MGMSAYDDWRCHGNRHKCVCGSTWTDSDGGPCHWECKCGKVVDEDSCHKKHTDYCEECGSQLEEETDDEDEADPSESNNPQAEE